MGRKKPRKPAGTPEEMARLRKQEVASQTDLMRFSGNALWIRVRQQLADRGVDPYTAILMDVEFDSFVDAGFVVTADGAVYQYALEWEGTMSETGVLTAWKDVTQTWRYLTTSTQGIPHRDSIVAALEVLADERRDEIARQRTAVAMREGYVATRQESP